jgi:hypothetical protein
MRWPDIALRLVLLAVWLGALYLLIRLDDSGWGYLLGGTIVTVLVGALANRWWVLAAPFLFAATVIVPLAGDDPCIEGSNHCFGVASYIAAILFVIPATVLLAVGIGARRLAAGRSEVRG